MVASSVIRNYAVVRVINFADRRLFTLQLVSLHEIKQVLRWSIGDCGQKMQGSREQGRKLRQSLYSAPVKTPAYGRGLRDATRSLLPRSGTLRAEEKGLFPLLPAPFPSASSVIFP